MRTRWGALLILIAGCGGGSTPPPVDAGTDAPAEPVDANVVDAYHPPHDAGPMFDLGTADRPAPVMLPTAYDGTTALPLIVLIHADGVTGQVQQAYLHLGEAARASGAYLVLPTGTRDTTSNFLVWNDGISMMSSVDDVAYLTSVVDQAEAMLPVDTHRIYFVGHSNGGFMAYRMACALAPRVAGIAAINAGDYPFETDCTPARPVSVLHLHGTMDMVVPYDGSFGVFAGAVDATTRWAMRAGCNTAMTTSPALMDLDATAAGTETLATDYAAGCTGARVSLYTMNGSVHIPSFTTAAGTAIVSWLLARSAP